MSFGFSVGDFLAVGSLALKLYLSYKDGPSDFRELCRELLTLHTTLDQLHQDADDPTSIISRCGRAQRQGLIDVVGRCNEVLVELDELKAKYTKLEDGAKQKVSWTRIKYVKENAGAIRHKLSMHLNSITVYLAGVGNSSLSRIERKLETLARIEAKIDALFDEIKKSKDAPRCTEAAIILASHHTNAFPWEKADIDEKVDEIIDVLGDDYDYDGISKEDLQDSREFIGALVLWRDGQDSNAVAVTQDPPRYPSAHSHSRYRPQSENYSAFERPRSAERTSSTYNYAGQYSGIKPPPPPAPAPPPTAPPPPPQPPHSHGHAQSFFVSNTSSDHLPGTNYRRPQVEDDDEADFDDTSSRYSEDSIHWYDGHPPDPYPAPPRRRASVRPRQGTPDSINSVKGQVSTSPDHEPSFDSGYNRSRVRGDYTVADYPTEKAKHAGIQRWQEKLQEKDQEWQTLRQKDQQNQRTRERTRPSTQTAWWRDIDETNPSDPGSSLYRAKQRAIARFQNLRFSLGLEEIRALEPKVMQAWQEWVEEKKATFGWPPFDTDTAAATASGGRGRRWNPSSPGEAEAGEIGAAEAWCGDNWGSSRKGEAEIHKTRWASASPAFNRPNSRAVSDNEAPSVVYISATPGPNLQPPEWRPRRHSDVEIPRWESQLPRHGAGGHW